MNKKPSKRKLVAVSVLAFAACPVALYTGINPAGAPPIDSLSPATGLVKWIETDRRSIKFGLSSSDATFAYHSKGGALGLVKDGLQRGRREDTVILFSSSELIGPIWSNEKAFSVFEVTVGGSPIRTHESVDSARRSDNRIGLWLGIALGAIGAFLAYCARQQES